MLRFFGFVWHAYQFDREDAPELIVQPEIVQIPDFTSMTDEEVIEFAETIYEKYLTDECTAQLRESLAADCLSRIRSYLAGCAGPDQVAEFNNRVILIQKLMKPYCFGVFGIPMNGSFNGPAHLWQNNDLMDNIFEFFSLDGSMHHLSNTSLINDCIDLYCKRITRG